MRHAWGWGLFAGVVWRSRMRIPPLDWLVKNGATVAGNSCTIFHNL